MNERAYLTTGEIAKIVGVSKDTLFHYEKMGLFVPEMILKNHYRYYSFKQVELLTVIVTLRELGMPLSEIKSYLEIRNAQTLIEMLSREEEIIDQKIAMLKKSQKWIKQKKQQVQCTMQIDPEMIQLVHQPKRYYIHKQIEKSDMLTISKCLGKLVQEYHQAEKNRDYEVVYIQNEEYIKNDIYDAYREIALCMLKKPKSLNYTVKEEGNYLVTYHKGHWDTVGESYRKLISYAKKHHLILSEEYYEYDVINQLTVSDYENYVIQIEVRVE